LVEKQLKQKIIKSIRKIKKFKLRSRIRIRLKKRKLKKRIGGYFLKTIGSSKHKLVNKKRETYNDNWRHRQRQILTHLCDSQLDESLRKVSHLTQRFNSLLLSKTLDNGDNS
jgi:hypothetical protein